MHVPPAPVAPTLNQRTIYLNLSMTLTVLFHRFDRTTPAGMIDARLFEFPESKGIQPKQFIKLHVLSTYNLSGHK